MQMTHTLKALAAAVTMTFALGAQAAPISSDNFNLGANIGGGTGDGSLVLLMLDGGNARSLVFNTGLTANSFNAQAAASFDVTIAAPDLAQLNSFLGGVTNQAAFRWNLLSLTNLAVNPGTGTVYDSVGYLTTAAVGTAITTANSPNSLVPGVRNAMTRANTFFNANNSAAGNPLATGNVAVNNTNSGASAYARLGTNIGGSGSFNTNGLLGQSLDFFAYTGKGTTVGLNQVKSTQYLGEWKLDYTPAGNTALSYTVAPIPVPAAVWMLGSGIAGLIATRRRKAS